MLPREVLSEVFFIIAHDAFTARIESHPTFAWLRLAHVCRDWRDILLNSPRSFSFFKIPMWEKGRLETCLHYSRQAPLNIRYYDDRCSRRGAKLYAREQWLSLLPHLGRAGTLGVKINLAKAPPLLLSKTLTRLSLHDLAEYAEKSSELTLARTNVDRIFAASPNLLHLTSDAESLGGPDWTERAFPRSLKSLVVGHDLGPSYMPSLLCLVSALRKLPSLRRVDFRGLSEPDYFDTIGSSPAARIQPLRSLCLGGHSRSCISIFSSLESVDVLDLRPRLYKESDDLMAMNSFMDGLISFSRRYSWTRGDPYVLLLLPFGMSIIYEPASKVEARGTGQLYLATTF